jgi:hypothetical protein
MDYLTHADSKEALIVIELLLQHGDIDRKTNKDLNRYATLLKLNVPIHDDILTKVRRILEKQSDRIQATINDELQEYLNGNIDNPEAREIAGKNIRLGMVLEALSTNPKLGYIQARFLNYILNKLKSIRYYTPSPEVIHIIDSIKHGTISESELDRIRMMLAIVYKRILTHLKSLTTVYIAEKDLIDGFVLGLADKSNHTVFEEIDRFIEASYKSGLLKQGGVDKVRDLSLFGGRKTKQKRKRKTTRKLR